MPDFWSLSVLQCIRGHRLLPLLLSLSLPACRTVDAHARLPPAPLDRSVRKACPCMNEALCAPVGGPPVAEKEVFGFLGHDSGSTIDFSRVTTIAWPDDSDDLLCRAHAAGTRLVIGAPSPEKVMMKSAEERRKWIDDLITIIQLQWMDGVVFDWEGACDPGAEEQKAYASLMAETRQRLHAVSASYQVTVCVAWSPDGIDGRNYDVVAFSHAVDLLYIMDYDTRSQIFDACLAGANAPLPGTMRGVQRYLDLGIEASKLILGVPWYGYRYPCSKDTAADAQYCPIASVPFRGVNCSDAAGREVPVDQILEKLRSSSTGRRWDANQHAPWFNSVEEGELVQYWYDDIDSLRAKYAFARSKGLKGVGPYTFSDVSGDYGTKMFEAFDSFLLQTSPMGGNGTPSSDTVVSSATPALVI
mmetsp:Transcript_35360/g.82655  ORF Transcript_35360/g.82655 Transcript_35360/m.82655 type:complete len:416 (-) Transcript_35360:24-1271(-)